PGWNRHSGADREAAIAEDARPPGCGNEERTEERQRIWRVAWFERRTGHRPGTYRLVLRGRDGQRVGNRHAIDVGGVLREHPESAAAPDDDVLYDVGASLSLRARWRHPVDQGEHERCAREDRGPGELRAHRAGCDVRLWRLTRRVEHRQRTTLVR